ncbi:putative TRAM, LAG1 and CLN8 homology domain [Lyophyllum shimeji]|uniref:TRAM, LAG1 and CLN8 homology domain n=1 Tax=Lyophyllum shimeji TaxID=47721 RepID=A0A9P3UIW0_LYOSH|nr:putative TRAM, LAG1 and CLN8 homology domain [Lyophyllum shimeji]
MGVLETFVTDTLGLTKFPPYLPTFLYAFLGFSFVHQILAPFCSRKWFPVAFGSKNARARNSWSIHVVSQVHTVIIVPLSLWVLWHESPERVQDRAFGWDHRTGYVHAIACGYFLWDSLDAIVNFTDLGFVIHGVACFAIYTMSFKPFVAYYGTRCLLWETSTFFLNIHWFLDKTGRTGSTAQLINGFFLLSSFFGVRLVYGGKVSYDFVHTLAQVRREVPISYVLVYGAGNVILTSLNWFWFYKMIDALRRRFGEDKPKERRRLVSGTLINGDSENGHAHGEERSSSVSRDAYGSQA